MIKLRILKKYFICYWRGHLDDWDEFDMRLEKEGHYADTRSVLCRRCARYRVL